jgi:hypothetical protein
LEFSEFLKLAQEEDPEETPLLHDYLKLFSRIIPVSQSPRTAYISFHGADRAAARRLASNLREDGVDVWLDENELKLGDDVSETILNAIEKCSVFIPLISGKSKTGFREDGKIMFHYREWEWVYSLNNKTVKPKTIIPVIIDDTDWMYGGFKEYHHAKIPGGKRIQDYEKLKERLLELQMIHKERIGLE